MRGECTALRLGHVEEGLHDLELPCEEHQVTPHRQFQLPPPRSLTSPWNLAQRPLHQRLGQPKHDLLHGSLAWYFLTDSGQYVVNPSRSSWTAYVLLARTYN